MNPRAREFFGGIFNNTVIVGVLTILVVMLAVYLSYVAENGLPFVPTYTIYVDVPDGAQLVKDADVRLGGALVGKVLAIVPEQARLDRSGGNQAPFARLRLALDRDIAPLPKDTVDQVRLTSVLGGKYLAITPGDRRAGTVPDGGVLPLHPNSVGLVDIDQAFRTFGPVTSANLRRALEGLGNALAGRGGDLNDSIYALHAAAPALQRVLAMLASPRTHLDRLIGGAAATTRALAAVAPTLGQLFDDGATTLAALGRAGGALAATLDQSPPTESVGTTVLTDARPVLADATRILQALEPAADRLALATDRLDAIVRAATPVYRAVPALAGPLKATLTAVNRLAQDPRGIAAFKILGNNDLATFGASAFVGLGAILRAVAPAQFACNVAGIWAYNLSSSLSEGDQTAAWLRVEIVLDPPQGQASAGPAADLHLNFYPHENANECEAGNEPYAPGQLIGNPPGDQSRQVEQTAPPPGVTQRAIAAGVLPRGWPR